MIEFIIKCILALCAIAIVILLIIFGIDAGKSIWGEKLQDGPVHITQVKNVEAHTTNRVQSNGSSAPYIFVDHVPAHVEVTVKGSGNRGSSDLSKTYEFAPSQIDKFQPGNELCVVEGELQSDPC